MEHGQPVPTLFPGVDSTLQFPVKIRPLYSTFFNISVNINKFEIVSRKSTRTGKVSNNSNSYSGGNLVTLSLLKPGIIGSVFVLPCVGYSSRWIRIQESTV